MSDTESHTDTNNGAGDDNQTSRNVAAGGRQGSVLNLDRLNTMLGQMTDGNCHIGFYPDSVLRQIDDVMLTAIAECLVHLAYEKWHEKLSVDAVREELGNQFRHHTQENLLTLLFHGNDVIGLCWSVAFSTQDRQGAEALISSPRLQNCESIDKAWSWILENAVGGKLVTVRELGVIKRFEHIRASLQCVPVFTHARELGCANVFLHTPIASDALKRCHDMGFVATHHCEINQVLLVLSDLEATIKEYEFRMLEYFAGRLSDIIRRDQHVDEVLHRAEMNNNERLHVMQSLSANIAHEMRTPLSGVRASMAGVEDFLPQLVEAYRTAKCNDPASVPAIREEHLSMLASTPQRIALMVDQANSVIDMLLMNLRDNTVDKKNFGICSAAVCVRQAMERYPFKRGEREKVFLELENDFHFRGLDNLFIYVLFNLLKNALYSINSALEGEILITLVPDRSGNSLVFRDTGEGIPEDVIRRIFDGFFSTREEGTGVGLAFCRRTIQSFDGDIHCQSEPGVYAEFMITLPPV